MEKNKKLHKFLIATMGPGETIQGAGFAKYLLKKGEKVAFATRLKSCYSLSQDLKQKGAKLVLTDTPEKFNRLLKKEKPDVLVLCNSKIVSYYKDFIKKPPFPKPITVSLDSNWLFSKRDKWYSFAEWIDKYLIIFPEKIFRLGLKNYGGNFIIPITIMKKIETVGFVPSYKKPLLKNRIKTRKKYKIKEDEKLIFSYFSGSGAGFRFWALENLIKVVIYLIQEGLKIKVIYVGPTETLEPEMLRKNWLINKRWLTEKEFFLALTSSDLVFQHQGLGTLVQAISSQKPVIANVRDLKDEPYPRFAHDWEISPFAKLNLCKMFYKSTPPKKIAKEIKKLLYDREEIRKMKDAQEKYYEPGEAKAYQIVMKLLKTQKKS